MSQPYLQKFYQDTVVAALKEELGLENVHQVPKVTKVVLNSAFDANADKSQIDETVKDLTAIAGQKVVTTKASKSVSNFKLREGMTIGAKVTLRGHAMWDFLYRLIAVSLPGIRDFRGVKDKLDGSGNYSLGITDHTIFPETQGDGNKRQMGLDICIVTTAESDEHGRALLKHLGMPFRKRQQSTPAAA